MTQNAQNDADLSKLHRLRRMSGVTNVRFPPSVPRGAASQTDGTRAAFNGRIRVVDDQIPTT